MHFPLSCKKAIIFYRLLKFVDFRPVLVVHLIIQSVSKQSEKFRKAWGSLKKTCEKCNGYEMSTCSYKSMKLLHPPENTREPC